MTLEELCEPCGISAQKYEETCRHWVEGSKMTDTFRHREFSPAIHDIVTGESLRLVN
jgi:hypothetical protein